LPPCSKVRSHHLLGLDSRALGMYSRTTNLVTGLSLSLAPLPLRLPPIFQYILALWLAGERPRVTGNAGNLQRASAIWSIEHDGHADVSNRRTVVVRRNLQRRWRLRAPPPSPQHLVFATWACLLRRPWASWPRGTDGLPVPDASSQSYSQDAHSQDHYDYDSKN